MPTPPSSTKSRFVHPEKGNKGERIKQTRSEENKSKTQTQTEVKQSKQSNKRAINPWRHSSSSVHTFYRLRSLASFPTVSLPLPLFHDIRSHRVACAEKDQQKIDKKPHCKQGTTEHEQQALTPVQCSKGYEKKKHLRPKFPVRLQVRGREREAETDKEKKTEDKKKTSVQNAG